jgi:diguanylate cyclase (GGDEF)-like protein
VAARRAAASDREHARQDRGSAGSDRGFADGDRGLAGQDREHSGVDRSASGDDRHTSLEDRTHGGGERTSAASDREHAQGDRDGAAADRHSASLDDLTGAYLRRPGLLQLERDLSRVSRDGGELVVAFVDVDQLKAVNDQGGHAAGDLLLHHVVQSLQARLRPHDLIIRFGGDEFVCVVAGLNLDDVSSRLQQANDALAQSTPRGSFTVGFARRSSSGDTALALIERADRALYQQRATRQLPN